MRRHALKQRYADLGIGILQISQGLTYTRTSAGASGQAGDLLSNVRLNGVPLVDGQTYRVTVNNFLADGGDNYTVLRQGTNRFYGEIDLIPSEQYGLGEAQRAEQAASRAVAAVERLAATLA